LRFILLNQFHPPDLAPTGRLLRDLARELGARGHDVRVICSRGAYEGGTVAGPADPAVTRVPALGRGGRLDVGRLADHALYLAGAFVAGLLSPRPDVVVSLTTPPYLGVAGHAIARLRGAAHAHWVMDVYPDALAAHGLIRRQGIAWRALERLARWQWTGAGAVIAIGPWMARRLEGYVPAGPVAWVPLWADAPTDDGFGAEEIRATRARRGWSDRDLVLLCSGRLGLGHRFDEFLAAAAQLGAAGPVWAFVGDGARRGDVEGFARDNPGARIALHPPVAARELPASLGSGDVHLIGMAPGWEGLIVPSRLQAAFAAARPVIFVGPDACEVADWLRESHGGWVAAPGDVSAVLAAVEAARDPAERARRGAAARAFASERFDRARNCGRVADLVESAAPTFARRAAID
jgi:glycosyltransferase involved in cell wall biosynthesis